MIAYTAHIAYTAYIAYSAACIVYTDCIACTAYIACIASIAYICIYFTYIAQINPQDGQIGETGLSFYFQSMIMIEMMKTRGCCDYIEL